MKVILDTNVFISGVFFKGSPYEILKAWRDGKIQIVLSPEILEEYRRVGEILAKQFPGVELGSMLELLTVNAGLIMAPKLPKSICADPHDDKFLACAIASKVSIVVSGDKHLLKVSGYQGIHVLTPRSFVDKYLGSF